MSIKISVNIDQIQALSDLICEIDEVKKQPEMLALIVSQAHDALIAMLGEHEHLVYAPDEDEVLAA
jgi:hypothetical protein